VDDEVLISLDVVNFEVGEVGVNADGQVGRKGPRSGGPGEEGGGGVVDEGEGDGDCAKEEVMMGEGREKRRRREGREGRER